MHTNRYNTNSGATIQRDRDSGSSSPISTSATSSFYNLQMYSTPTLHTHNAPINNTISPPLNNLYQNIQEISYHPDTPLARPLATPIYRSTPSPPNTLNSVHKNGITFVDPFHQANNITEQQKTQQIYPTNTQSRASSFVTQGEAVIQPLFATFGTESIFVTCPYCHHTAETDVEQVIGSEALLWACIIPLAGLLLKSKWDTRHRCKNCLNVIGIHYP